MGSYKIILKVDRELYSELSVNIECMERLTLDITYTADVIDSFYLGENTI